jgi:hypothetical protein
MTCLAPKLGPRGPPSPYMLNHNAHSTYAEYILADIYIGGYILSIRSDVVVFTKTPPLHVGKNPKKQKIWSVPDFMVLCH